jgi:hypothetical protein
MGRWRTARGSGDFSEDYVTEVLRHGDFLDSGLPLFDSEELTDTLLRLYLGLTVDGWAAERGCPFPVDCVGQLYTRGLWLPCVPRVVLAGQVDVRNDGVPDFAAIPLQMGDNVPFAFAVAQRVPRLPRGWAGQPGATAHVLGGILGQPQHREREVRRSFDGCADYMEWRGWYLSVVGDRVLPARGLGDFPHGAPAAGVARMASAALQVVADFRHLWTVETEEQPLSSDTRTPLRLGVDAALVKSLFYARQAPRTETGRRRPILHWVDAHKRRLKAGIDVDVREHLRGVRQFEMDGFPFRITSPDPLHGKPA